MANEIPNNSPSISELEKLANRSLLIKLMTKPKAFYENFIDRIKQDIEHDKFISAEAMLNGVLGQIKDLNEFKIVQKKLSNLTYDQLDILGLLDKLPVILNAHLEALLSKFEINPISNRNPIQPPKQGNDIKPEPQIPESSKPNQSTPQKTIPNTTPNTIAPTITGINGSLNSISIPPSGPTTPGALHP